MPTATGTERSAQSNALASALAVARRGLRLRSSNCDAPIAPARRRSPRLRSEEHTSELQSLMRISYAVFCLKKKKEKQQNKKYTLYMTTQRYKTITDTNQERS